MIRPATTDDAEAINKLLTRDLREAWPVDYLAGIIGADDHSTMVEEVAGQVIGFCLMHPRLGEVGVLEHVFCWPRDMGRVRNITLVEAQVAECVKRGWCGPEPEWLYASESDATDTYARIEFGARVEDGLVRGKLLRSDLERVKSGGRLSPQERTRLGR